MDVIEELKGLADERLAQFNRKLIPAIDEKVILGIRTPALRELAKRLSKDESCPEFLRALPHKYFEENQVHGFVVADIKDFEECIKELQLFLPYMDNWATCDQTSPKVFAKNRELLMPYIREWIASEEPYTVRFAVNMLMQHYLDEDFREEYLDMVADIKTGHYYVQMVIAWYFATALAKRYDYAIKIIEAKRLDKWIHNKTIQKANESYRVSEEHKRYLKGLKIK